ncbi:hypothetical protein UA08_06197 [Talaromyces atroroseus]|uniref:non-specific serine/threonine protein kinase n=1 Tax=Talaromyces atroroseus TaxID=1441469 RepID=A0A225AH11_TALAT|nr:hypothetical protein UA08_06197 [Talaromyces atroroseus]OKL58503.1 hypothetical protein UA08_06197 [Talaromyces atroroseus]
MSSLQWTSARRTFPNTGFKLLDSSVPIEEETLPTYIPEKYYPVQQGEVFHERYQVLVKLGFGTTSTIWLSRDLLESRYVALKVYVTGNKQNNHEVEIYEHLNSIQANHPGPRLIRKLFDHFSIEGPHDTCPFSGKVQNVNLDQDLQLRNLLLPAPNIEKLSRFEELEVQTPSPRKLLKDRTIYASVGYLPTKGLPLSSDFGEARFGDRENSEDIMPTVYRAPEVVLKANWDHDVDIWGVAMLAWDLVSSHILFHGHQ